MRGDDLERQDVNNIHGRQASGTLNSKATRLLMSHEVMFAVLGERASVSVLACVWFHVQPCSNSASSVCHPFSVCACVCACMNVMDREQTKSVRAPGQLIRYVRFPPVGPAATFIGPPIFPKWQTSSIKTSLCHTEHLNLATDKQADVSSRAIRTVIVPFHTRFPLFTGHLLWEK